MIPLGQRANYRIACTLRECNLARQMSWFVCGSLLFRAWWRYVALNLDPWSVNPKLKLARESAIETPACAISRGTYPHTSAVVEFIALVE